MCPSNKKLASTSHTLIFSLCHFLFDETVLDSNKNFANFSRLYFNYVTSSWLVTTVILLKLLFSVF